MRISARSLVLCLPTLPACLTRADTSSGVRYSRVLRSAFFRLPGGTLRTWFVRTRFLRLRISTTCPIVLPSTLHKTAILRTTVLVEGKNGYELRLAPGRDGMCCAIANRGLFLQRSVYIKRGSWNSALQAEIHSFPNGEHDDQIDCLSLIGRRLPEMYTPTPTKRFVPAIEQVIKKAQDGGYYIDRELETLFQDRERMRSWRGRNRI